MKKINFNFKNNISNKNYDIQRACKSFLSNILVSVKYLIVAFSMFVLFI